MDQPVAVDAMGGDHAPEAIIEGALLAAHDGIPIALVGHPDLESSARHDLVRWVAASEVIGMADEPGRAIRRKKDASVLRAAQLVRDGEASAFVGAGNTGATMGAALLRIGRLPGVRRPAIAVLVPSPGSDHSTVFLDAGANSETNDEMIVQHASIGVAYARARRGVARPTVALLNVGEEAGKGPERVRELGAALASDRWQAAAGATFVGHAEGRDLFAGTYDVVVTDGFTGNVALKSMEGVTTTLMAAVVDALGATPGPLEPLTRRFDPDVHGGALLAGLKGVVVIAHGASTPVAVAHAIRLAKGLVDSDVIRSVRDVAASWVTEPPARRG